VKESVKQDKVAQYIAGLGKKGKGLKKVFMVTGVMCVSGLRE
jgi:hypothetical protein